MTVDILVKAGADLAVADQTAGDTALLRAARTGKPESLKILLDAGADLKATNKTGQTALHLAAASGNVEKVKFLLAAKADPAAVDAKGWAPIDHAMNRTAGDKTKLLEVLQPVSPAPQPVESKDAASAPKGT
jgi:ankyrin repeat protein